MMTEKYARPGVYHDTDDHGRLIRENRRSMRRERAHRIYEKLRKIDTALEVVQNPTERAELKARKESLIDELDELRP